eukprot:6943297-Pyramimonas_sp.AAC.1
MSHGGEFSRGGVAYNKSLLTTRRRAPKERENIPTADTNRRRRERIYPPARRNLPGAAARKYLGGEFEFSSGRAA